MASVGMLVFGVLVGALSGGLGIGGGVVLVPGLIMLFGFSQLEAQGTSLAVLSVPVVIFAAAVYYQNGFVRVPVVLLIGLGFILGAYFGAKLVPQMPIHLLRLGFGVLMLYISFLFILDLRSARPAAALPAAIATVVAAVITRLFRRRVLAHRSLHAPTAELEYHI